MMHEKHDLEQLMKHCYVYRLLHEKINLSTEELQCELQKES